MYANGERLIDDFQPGTLTDPLQLPAGSYDLALYPADPRTRRVIRCCPPRRCRARRRNATVVAHLTADGSPR